MIDLINNYYFEFTQGNIPTFDSVASPRVEMAGELPSDTFLGKEYLYGKLKHKLLDKFFPTCHVTFFPLVPTSLDQACMIQNLQKEKYFNHFSHVLVDWPKEFTPHLAKIISSFPNPVCLTTKSVFEKGVFEKQNENQLEQLKTNPLFFLESFCPRRHIAHQFDDKNITCVGGLADCLQLNLYAQKNNSLFLLSNGLLPWLNSQFVFHSNISSFTQAENASTCKNILHSIFKKPQLNILIITHFHVLNSLNTLLEKFDQKEDLIDYIENKVTYLTQADQTHLPQLYISQPSSSSCLEYSQLNGFISRQLYAALPRVSNWLDNLKLYFTNLFFTTAAKYTEWTKMNVTASEQRDFFRFVYRLALEKKQVFPDTFDLLLAAKAVINSNFAYEMHKELQQFPLHPSYENTLKQVELPLDSFFERTQKISLQKFATIQAQKSLKKTKIQSVHKNRAIKNVDPISEDKYLDNKWVNEDHPYSCSFPNEDIFMEKLALDLKKNMQEKIKEKEQLLRELQSDFCDGLDLRETIRNWHREKIIIKEILHVGKADIGAVVFAFAQPQDDERFSWQSFWLAEQHDDSHLMFYATPFKDNLIGPGIAKSEFGGFAVIPLDSYIEHPWHHPYILSNAQSNTDCLILAGALSSPHKSILFISLHPPSQHIIKILKQSGKNIIYARLDEFSQSDIRRVRTFHILAEAGVRTYAQKYIRKD